MKARKIQGYELKLMSKLGFAELVEVFKKEWGIEVVGKPSNYLHSDGMWHPFAPVEGYLVWKNEMIQGQPEWYLIPCALANSASIFHEGYDTRYAEGVLHADAENGKHTPVQQPLASETIRILNTSCPKGCEAKIFQYSRKSAFDPVRDRFFAVPDDREGHRSSPIMASKNGEPMIPEGSWELIGSAWVRCVDAKILER